MEYRVAHEPWRVWDATSAEFSGDGAALYGDEFKHALSAKPYSAAFVTGNGGFRKSGRTVSEARQRAYQAVDLIKWPEGFCRRDIGWQAVKRERAGS